MSYHGRLNFGLLGDYDAMPDLDRFVVGLRESIAELMEAAGIEAPPTIQAAPQVTPESAASQQNGASAPSSIPEP
jgi:hypothetical protein